MRLTLTGEVTVSPEGWFGEVGWHCPRPEYAALCATALPEGRLTEESVQSLVPGLGPAGAHNILRACEDVGLTNGGLLTRAGQKAARTGIVAIPEQGTYVLYRVHDPVVGIPIAHVERLSPSRRPADGDPRPDRGLLALQESAIRSLVKGGPTVELRSLGNGGAPLVLPSVPGHAPATLTVTLEIDERGARWLLDGRIGQRAIDPTVAWGLSAATPTAVLRDLQQTGALCHVGTFVSERGRLAVALDDRVTEPMRQTFARDLTLEGVTALGRRWDRIHVEALGLEPDTAHTAAAWALHNLGQRVDARPRHRTPAEVAEVHGGIVQGTPLERFHLQAPGPEALARAWAGNPRRMWSVLAAHDLDLSPADDAMEEAA